MKSHRYEQLYHGYKIIVDLWKKKYQGKAFFGVNNWGSKKALSAEGATTDEVLLMLQTLVDERNEIEGRNTLKLHQDYLASIGKSGCGYSSDGRPRNPPQWHCFNCNSHFDRFMGLLCLSCNTEVCPNCGACHCGIVF